MNAVGFRMNSFMTEPIGPSPASPPAAPPESHTDPGSESAASPAAQADASRSPAYDRFAMSDLVVTDARPFETRTVPASEDRLSKLQALLNSLEEKKRELQQDLVKVHSEKLELNKAAAEIRSAIEENRPIPAAVMSMLGVLGVVAAVGGFPVIAWAVGVFGAIFGLSDNYKSKANQAAAQVDAKAGEKEAQADGLKSEVEEIDTKIKSVVGSIEREKALLQQQALPARERALSTKAIVEDPGWQGFLGNESRIYLGQSGIDSAPALLRKPLLTR